MNQEEPTLQSDEPIKNQGWVIEFDPELKILFEDEQELDYELDM